MRQDSPVTTAEKQKKTFLEIKPEGNKCRIEYAN